MDEKYYVAYGSNLNLSHMQRCCPGARPVGTSEILDYELLFKGNRSGFYLTIEPCKGGLVPVAIWKLSKGDEKRLDNYEGYPSLYYKKTMQLPMTSMTSGSVILVSTFVYIMYEDKPPGAPSKYYYDTCLEGYDSFGFHPKYLTQALDRSRKLLEENPRTRTGRPWHPFQDIDNDEYI